MLADAEENVARAGSVPGITKPYFMSGDPKEDAQGSDNTSCLRRCLLLPIHVQALAVWTMRRIKGCLYEKSLPRESWHLPDIQVSFLSPPPVPDASLQVVVQWFNWSGDWCNGWT